MNSGIFVAFGLKWVATTAGAGMVVYTKEFSVFVSSISILFGWIINTIGMG